MSISQIISDKRKQRGIPVSELSRRTDIPYEALRTSLEGSRSISAHEFLALCKELELTLQDFDGEDLVNGLR